ncbi:MAG: hypothetical protein RL564_97 [Pseudomonadota bacterium]|jgi:hypothetical protein
MGEWLARAAQGDKQAAPSGRCQIPTVSSVSVPEITKPQISQRLLSTKEETAIRAWLALIDETDPATIAEVISHCQQDADVRDYFIGRAGADLPRPSPILDDRRTCDQCTNWIARRCQAAKRGEIMASRNFEPIPDLPRRCEGYAPGAADPDQRHGRERWPGLFQKGCE